MRVLKFLFRTFVGGVFYYMVNPDLISMALLAVICTAGIGLTAVIPIFYFTGVLLTMWFLPLSNQEADRVASQIVGSTQAESKIPRHLMQALTDYVRKAAVAGESWQDVQTELLMRGWKQEELKFALELYEKNAHG